MGVMRDPAHYPGIGAKLPKGCAVYPGKPTVMPLSSWTMGNYGDTRKLGIFLALITLSTD